MPTLFLILSVLAGTPNEPPTVSAGDVLVCEFEEATDRDYDGWPDGWIRRRSRELPEFLKIGILPEAPPPSRDASASGPINHCLVIQLDGGGAVISSPRCLVSPQFSLLLSVR